ncbi:zinc-binding dehydrogenase [Nocardia sp. CDC159]|uniref:Zinc-binding dehydrogenase n=1 Tax=Nocardia pulmonis TaxID=2951408 RepID=A0A9X2ECT6_9NOCA|nr:MULTISPECIES: zinc-binding dehydrogenase [Nocardia]MCM6777030.1 zinc-binding dehydrogenase [Nocardia pulmonis]MCM6789454.1 zinc-binding dehydrogenase [Nocardia sp. CDC159]
MLAARLHLGKERRLEVEEVPVPEPGPDHVLIKVEAAGVCLSDVHLVDGTLSPLYLKGEVVTLGHEVAGTVHALGPGVTQAKVGDRVVLQAGELRNGAVFTRGVDYDGGWAEYTVARVDTLVPLPDDLPFEQACFIPDAVSTPWAAITATAQVRPAEPVGVWGVGGLGAHGVQLLRLVGAAPIIAVDPLPAARQRALEFGADFAFDPADEELRKKIYAATNGAGLAAAFDFAGVAAVREQAAVCLGQGGRLVLVGLTDKPITLTYGTMFSFFGQQLRGHYGSEPEHVNQLVQLQRLHRIDFARSVSAVLPLSDAPKAVHALEAKEGNPIRLVLKP